MKRKITKVIVLMTFAFMAFVGMHAQVAQPNYALIDMQYLMEKIPQYKSATEQIQKQTEKWNKEIESYSNQARDLYLKYQKGQGVLSQNDLLKIEQTIVEVEEEATKLQQKYFGREGEAMKLQQKLIKPIQDNIYSAVKLISERRGYLIVFDRASSIGSIVYADPKADISNDVLMVLGIDE